MVLGTSISWFSFKIIISCTSCIFSLSQCGTTKNKRLGDQLLTCKSSAWNTREKGVESSLYPRKIGLYIDSQPKSRNSTTSLHCNPNHLRQTMLFENILKNIYIFKNCHAYATNNYQENYILASSRPVTCAKVKKSLLWTNQPLSVCGGGLDCGNLSWTKHDSPLHLSFALYIRVLWENRIFWRIWRQILRCTR